MMPFLPMMPFVLLDVYILLTIIIFMVINLPLEVGNVCLWGILLGRKDWRLYDLEKREFFVSRDVKFFEDAFPFLNPDDINIDLPMHLSSN